MVAKICGDCLKGMDLIDVRSRKGSADFRQIFSLIYYVLAVTCSNLLFPWKEKGSLINAMNGLSEHLS